MNNGGCGENSDTVSKHVIVSCAGVEVWLPKTQRLRSLPHHPGLVQVRSAWPAASCLWTPVAVEACWVLIGSMETQLAHICGFNEYSMCVS